ncbi:MAG: regulatory protein RecX [Oscillospiraceae bacterium]
MKITDVVKAKGERYTVYVDEEYFYIFDIEIIMQNGISIGVEVDEDDLDFFKSQAEKRTARERAYYLLGYRDHSKKELYDKLVKNARPEIANQIIDMVSEQGLLDDEKYAGKLARYYLSSKKWGKRRVMQEMFKRGIDKEIAINAIEQSNVNPIPQIIAIIEKKYYDLFEDYKSKQKAIAGLIRLGFDYDDIKHAIQEISDNV